MKEDGPRTFEDVEQRRARRLAGKLRDRPLLPPDPEDARSSWLDVHSGVKLPVAHCAFIRCTWTGKHSSDIERHLKQAHDKDFRECCELNLRADVPDEEDSDERWRANGYYCQAIAEIEREQMPLIGPSVDRRTFQHVTELYNDAKVKCLVCLVCACKKTMMCETNREIEYVAGKWLEEVSEEAMLSNLHFSQFRSRYATQEPLDRVPDFEEGNDHWEWRRTWRPSEGPGFDILCCPEDLYTTKACEHEEHVLCPTCQFPICRDCRIQMQKEEGAAVPQALANDNWYGYANEVIVQWEVRWIEMAVVLPFWTTMIVYYLEGDRGHLLTEQLGAQQHRWGVRGNCFSYHMPWEDIMAGLGRCVTDKELESPLAPEVLVHVTPKRKQ